MTSLRNYQVVHHLAVRASPIPAGELSHEFAPQGFAPGKKRRGEHVRVDDRSGCPAEAERGASGGLPSVGFVFQCYFDYMAESVHSSAGYISSTAWDEDQVVRATRKQQQDDQITHRDSIRMGEPKVYAA